MRVLALHPDRCTGCLRCELACSYMQTGTYQPSKSVIRVSPFEGYTSYAPYTCTQCAEGWCMTACPVGAIRINAVGAKDVVDDRCVGCKLCTIACPYGTMFFIDRSSVKVYKQRDFGFDDTDGRVLNKIAGYDAFEAFIKVYLNLGSEAPNRNAVIRGINHRFTP